MATPSEEELKRQRELLDVEKEMSKLRKDMTSDLGSYIDKISKSKELQYDIWITTKRKEELEKKISALAGATSKKEKEQLNRLKEVLKATEKEISYNNQIISQLKNRNNLLKAGLNSMLSGAEKLYTTLNIAHYLMDADQAIRDMGSDMGLGNKQFASAENHIHNAAKSTAKWGITVKDLTVMQSKYSEITGRNVLLNKKNYENISAIAKGTSLGVEGASEMAGNFENMGISVERAKGVVDGTIKSTMLLGVNAGKVFKTLNQNFKQAQKFSFKGGIAGFSKMAVYAEKFRIDISESFQMMDKSRTLEGAIEMATQLQLMGGKFAQADPFRMLHLARNDAEGFQKEMNGMLGGLSRYNKETKQFELASPVNRDIIDHIAKATGQSVDNLIQQSNKIAEIKSMQKDLGKFSPDQRKIIEGLARMGDNGKFEVEVGKDVFDISKLTGTQINTLKEQQLKANDLAGRKQGIEANFNNAMLELKSSMLPLLKGMNFVMESINKYLGGSDNIGASMVKAAGMFAAISFLTNPFGAIKLFGNILSKAGGLVGSGVSEVAGGGKGIMSKIFGNGGSTIAGGKGMTEISKGATSLPSGSVLQSKAAGLAAIGVAAVGIGAGIWMASKGLAELVTSFKGLTDKQANAAVLAITASMGGFALALYAAGAAGSASSYGLAIVAGVALAIGASVWMAGQGIGYMAGEITKLTDPNIGKNMGSIGAGMLGIGAAASMLGNPLALLGLGALTGFINSTGDAINFKDMKDAFNTGIQFAQSTTQLDKVKNILAEMAEIKLDSGGMFTELYKLLNELNQNGIKVDFGSGKVSLENNITLNIDRE
ncbi:MAG TPA: hypothetical protein VNX68_19140, partial [Nitrosopumilaceae archaeon]|nr:hypothetical protein [Nitrosopumilaceae archaeon]